MNNKTPWIIVGVIIILLIIGGFVVNNSNKNSQVASDTENTDQAMMEDETGDAMMEDLDSDGDAMMEDDKMMTDSDAMMQKAGSYLDYSPATVEAEQAKGNKVVLFFHAQWCPDCRAADAAFKANQDGIPAGVSVLKTDYDSNPALKQKYGVTYQHTFVQIDNNENRITSWVSGDIKLLQQNIK